LLLVVVVRNNAMDFMLSATGVINSTCPERDRHRKSVRTWKTRDYNVVIMYKVYFRGHRINYNRYCTTRNSEQ